VTTAEQKARDLLDRLEVRDAQSYSSGEIVELANLISERDALAERVDALHKALREHVLHGPITDNDHAGPFVSNGCMHCHASWSPSTIESHAPDCLAAPTAPKEAT
jgi:hypothetical protein